MKVYYFLNGSQNIIAYDYEVDTTKFTQLEKLTDEQLQFLQANPNATPSEVKNMVLIEHEIDLTVFKHNVLSQLDNISLSTFNEVVPQYKITNALLSLSNTENPIYSLEESNHIITIAESVGNECRNKYYTFKPMIESATSVKELMVIEGDCMEQYNGIKEKYLSTNA